MYSGNEGGTDGRTDERTDGLTDGAGRHNNDLRPELAEGKHRSCIQRVNRNIPKMFEIVLLLMSNLSWKLYKNPFLCFPVMLLTNTNFFENKENATLYPRGWTEHPQNVSDYFENHVGSIPKISWKSVRALFYNVANRQTKHQQRRLHNVRRSADVKYKVE